MSEHIIVSEQIIDDSRGACGLGVKVTRSGEPSHENVIEAVRTIEANAHRAGYSIDRKSSDGVGAGFAIPWGFVSKVFGIDAKEGEHGVAHMFLPNQEFYPEKAKQYQAARTIILESFERAGIEIIAERRVPVNYDSLGEAVRLNQPIQEQFLFKRADDFAAKLANVDAEMDASSPEAFRVMMYEAARNIERQREEKGLTIRDLAANTISDEFMVYKGLYVPSEFMNAHPDLQDPDFESSWFITHVRQATKTAEFILNAQPVTGKGTVLLAHNGEITTYEGNALSFIAGARAGGDVDFAFPAGISDSAMLAMAVERLIRRDARSLDEALVTLIPPSFENDPFMGQDEKNLFRLNRQDYQAWQGPAAIISFAGGTVALHTDNFKLRPEVYQFDKNTVYGGSEKGVLPFTPGGTLTLDEVNPGALLVVNTSNGTILTNKDAISAIVARTEKRIGTSLDAAVQARTSVLDTDKIILPDPAVSTHLPTKARQIAYGWDAETQSYFIAPMILGGKSKTIAMGNDSPSGDLRQSAMRGTEYLSIVFNQVNAPPLDVSSRKNQMSLTVNVGPKPGASDQAGQVETSCILRPGAYEVLIDTAKDAGIKNMTLDAVFENKGKSANHSEALWKSLDALADAAIVAVKDGAGIITLTDEAISPHSAAMPITHATSYVYKRLYEEGLSEQASIVVRSGQVVNPFDAYALICLGATCVDATEILPEIDRIRREQPNRMQGISREKAVENFYHGMEVDLLMTAGKFGNSAMDTAVGCRALEMIGLCTTEKDPQHYAIFGPIASGLGGITSRWGGDTFSIVADAYANAFHGKAIEQAVKPRSISLPQRGVLEVRPEGEAHNFGPNMVAAFRAMLSDDRTQRLAEMNQEMNKALDGVNDPERNSEIRAFFGRRIEYIIESDPAKLQNLEARKAVREKYRDVVDEMEQPFTPEQLNAWKLTDAYRKYRDVVVEKNEVSPTQRRHLFSIEQNCDAKGNPVERLRLDQVESPDQLIKRVFGEDMSVGALTMSAHSALVQGMKIAGAVMGSGEGGLDIERIFDPKVNPDAHQIGTSFIGTTAAYLASCILLRWKGGQGAKPGQGGEMPADKVDEPMAARRNSTYRTGIKSDYVHATTTSIEDLSIMWQALSLFAPVQQKVVAQNGIGYVATGSAKSLLFGGVDENGQTGGINIAGRDGGTAASPVIATLFSGQDSWDSAREAYQALCASGLKGATPLAMSGGFQIGEDFAKAALVGADKAGAGTLFMLAVGCIMLRMCNVPELCKPGVANWEENFRGDALDISRFFVNIVHDLRETMAEKGFKSWEEMQGKVEFLKFNEPKVERSWTDNLPIFDNTNFYKSPIDRSPDSEIVREAWPKPKHVDEQCLNGVRDVLEGRTSNFVSPVMDVTNADIAVGGLVSSTVAKHIVAKATAEFTELNNNPSFETAIAFEQTRTGYTENTFVLNFRGVSAIHHAQGETTFGAAGQAAGFAIGNGITVNIEGMVQDSAGMLVDRGGILVVKPPEAAAGKGFLLAGNNFGLASKGKVFCSGKVANGCGANLEGGLVVVEGCKNYLGQGMRSGVVINLGEFGSEGQGADAKGGFIFQFDPQHVFEKAASKDLVLFSLKDTPFEDELRKAIEEYAKHTGNSRAQDLLNNPELLDHFKVGIPKPLIKIMEKDNDDFFRGQYQTYVRRYSRDRHGMETENGGVIIHPEAPFAMKLLQWSLETQKNWAATLQQPHNPIQAGVSL